MLGNVAFAARLAFRDLHGSRSLKMKNRFLVSTIVAASIFAPAVAFAQTSAAPDNTGPGTAQTDVSGQHGTKMKSAKMKQEGTVGMGSGARSRPGGESVARKPAD